MTGTSALFITNDGENMLQKYKDIYQNIIVKKPSEINDTQPSSLSVVLCKLPDSEINNTFLSTVLKLLTPDGKLKLLEVQQPKKYDLELKVNGFIDVKIDANEVQAVKPKYELGTSTKLNFKPSEKSKTVWKLDDNPDEAETIDPDDLLDEDDLKKPDPSSLRVCSTTGKRKACKDCSCGLAEELAVEAQKGKVVDTANAPKSSCGSCYLGDAFRCATCPYLGMPAFKPGPT